MKKEPVKGKCSLRERKIQRGAPNRVGKSFDSGSDYIVMTELHGKGTAALRD
jgi:hypothetical protein